MSQLKASFRCTFAGPGPTRYVIGSAPRQSSGASGPASAASSGCASPYEIGSTGIFVRLGASLTASRFASFVAPTPGVSGSPGFDDGKSITLPRCTPSFGRIGPFGKTSPPK